MKSKGFTLIELLVVVAIISILATIVIASLGNAREKARVQKLGQELNSFRTAMELYYLDNGTYPMMPYNNFSLNRNTASYYQSSIDLFDGYFDMQTFLENLPEGTNIMYANQGSGTGSCAPSSSSYTLHVSTISPSLTASSQSEYYSQFKAATLYIPQFYYASTISSDKLINFHCIRA